MANDNSRQELDVLQNIISLLQPLEDSDRRRLLETVARFFDISGFPEIEPFLKVPNIIGQRDKPTAYSSNLSLSPKEFIFEKQPTTDIEKITCLAYYLTHYQGMPQFKTIDLSKLNTEAAQPKFSNAAQTANNAIKARLLIPTSKGNRQLSAIGEKFVEALPDREAASSALLSRKPKRLKRPK